MGSYELIGADLLADGLAKKTKGDLLHRALIRHDPEKVARIVMRSLNGGI